MKHDARPSPAPRLAESSTQSADATLMARLARGDMAALGELVCRHQASVWQLAYRVTGRWDWADDITQEAFLRVLRSASSYQPTAAW